MRKKLAYFALAVSYLLTQMLRLFCVYLIPIVLYVVQREAFFKSIVRAMVFLNTYPMADLVLSGGQCLLRC